MRKISVVLIFALLTASVTDARPWYKDWKVWTGIAITALVTYKQSTVTDATRLRAGIGQAYGGYGERNAMRGLAITTQLLGVAGSLAMRHAEDPAWPVPMIITNTVWGVSAIRQAGRSCKTLVVMGQCQDND